MTPNQLSDRIETIYKATGKLENLDGIYPLEGVEADAVYQMEVAPKGVEFWVEIPGLRYHAQKQYNPSKHRTVLRLIPQPESEGPDTSWHPGKLSNMGVTQKLVYEERKVEEQPKYPAKCPVTGRPFFMEVYDEDDNRYIEREI